MKGSFLLSIFACALSAVPARMDGNPNAELIKAVQHGDVAAIRTALAGGADPNAKDENGTPALMDAVLYGSEKCVSLLLEKGADVNARNEDGATALIWALGDPAKSLLLLAKGADVTAASNSGRTPLQVAAGRAGAMAVVAEMLEHGAPLEAKDHVRGFANVASGGGMATALIEAAKLGDSANLRLLLARCSSVNATDGVGATALSEAALRGNLESVELLLKRGANPNTSTSFWNFHPLTLAAMRGDAAVIRALIAAGADVNATTSTGDTALMWAAYSDRVYTDAVEALLSAGADPARKNKEGETALDWAVRRGPTAVVKMLRGQENGPSAPVKMVALQPEGKEIRSAIESAIAAMQPVGPVFVKKSGCVSCHHQSSPAVAVSMARERGLPVNEEIATKDLKATAGLMAGLRSALMEGADIMPDISTSGGNILIGLSRQNYPADRLTAAMVHNIAARQQLDGRWIAWATRPPIEDGDIQATALAIRAMQLYGPEGRKVEFDERIRRARVFLEGQKPTTTAEQTMRFLGLAWAGADPQVVKEAAQLLLNEQRADGGWAQLTSLLSDAYATGDVLAALHEAGVLDTGHPAYRNGIAYLMSTRQADGTWHVKTRAFPFQPLVDSGFPHGRDQWISIAATAKATVALEYALQR